MADSSVDVIVESTDGYYVLDVEARETPSSAVPKGTRGLALDAYEDIAFVQTLNQSSDERVSLLVDYWSDGERTYSLEYFAKGWPHVVRGVIEVATPLWVHSSDRAPVAQVTPEGGRFGFALHARVVSPDLVERNEPLEEHYMLCWQAS
jgi:hypothetical protein